MPEQKRESLELPSVSIYIPGQLPSSSELASYLTLFQGVLIWSGLAQVPNPSLWSSNEPKPLAWTIRESYHRFLRRKYEAPVLYGSSLLLGVEKVELEFERRIRDGYVTAGDALERFIDNRSLPRFESASGETNTELSDFYEWSIEFFGSRAIPVESIDTSGSIEFLFQLAPFLAIVGLQDYPVIKAVVLHAVSVLKSLIGKTKTKELPPVIKLPKSVCDVIVQFEDVEIESESDGSWRIRLKR